MRTEKLLRFQEITRDPKTPDQILQRMAEGQTLNEIADAWDIPRTRLAAWVATQAELSDACKRIRETFGHELRMEGLDIIDEATPDDISVRRERAAYRERLSKAFNPKTYGDQPPPQRELPSVVINIASLRGEQPRSLDCTLPEEDSPERVRRVVPSALPSVEPQRKPE